MHDILDMMPEGVKQNKVGGRCRMQPAAACCRMRGQFNYIK